MHPPELADLVLLLCGVGVWALQGRRLWRVLHGDGSPIAPGPPTVSSLFVPIGCAAIALILWATELPGAAASLFIVVPSVAFEAFTEGIRFERSRSAATRP